MITFTSLLGFAGIFLNNRTFLAIFTLLLWVDFGLLVAPGYITYKQKTFNLEGKINSQWSRYLGTEGRLRIQDAVCDFPSFPKIIRLTQILSSCDAVVTILPLSRLPSLLFVILDPISLVASHNIFVLNVAFSESGLQCRLPLSPLTFSSFLPLYSAQITLPIDSVRD